MDSLHHTDSETPDLPKRKRLFAGLGVVALLAVIGLAACYQGTKPTSTTTPVSTATGKQTPVRIGYSRLRISLPVFVAQERGIFAKHGINAQLEAFDTAQPLMQALVEGQIDVGGYSALPITYAAMQRSGKKLYFVTTMIEDQQHRISYLLRRKPDAGQKAEIQNIADLKGKRIGILPTVAYKAWLQEILRANGLNPDKDVTIQQIAPTEQVATLKNGGVDALFTNDPAATAAILTNTGELISDTVEAPRYLGDPFPFGSFNISKEWADRNPEMLNDLVAALDEAATYTNDNPIKAQQALVPYLPAQFKGQIGKYPPALYLTSKQSKQETYTRTAQEYQKQGILSGPVDVNGLVVSPK